MAASITKVQLISHFLGQPGMGRGGYNSGQERLQDRTDAGVRGYVYPVVFGELPADIVLFPPGSEHHCVMAGAWMLEIAVMYQLGDLQQVAYLLLTLVFSSEQQGDAGPFPGVAGTGRDNVAHVIHVCCQHRECTQSSGWFLSFLPSSPHQPQTGKGIIV